MSPPSTFSNSLRGKHCDLVHGCAWDAKNTSCGLFALETDTLKKSDLRGSLFFSLQPGQQVVAYRSSRYIDVHDSLEPRDQEVWRDAEHTLARNWEERGVQGGSYYFYLFYFGEGGWGCMGESRPPAQSSCWEVGGVSLLSVTLPNRKRRRSRLKKEGNPTQRLHERDHLGKSTAFPVSATSPKPEAGRHAPERPIRIGLAGWACPSRSAALPLVSFASLQQSQTTPETNQLPQPPPLSADT